MIYLDNAATTPMLDEVKEVMIKDYYNPSSIHKAGIEAKTAIDKARNIIAKAISCNPKEIIFTSGGTEANNLALRGYARNFGGGKIITTQIEHPSVLKTCKHLERKGFEVIYLPVNDKGLIDLEDLKKELTLDTILVSIMSVNNEIGTQQNIKEIGDMCRRYNRTFHTDAVQAFGHIPINVHRLNIDMMSVSGHKFGAPKGTGFLYKKKNIDLKRIMYGGKQERKIRAGTQNVNGIVGLGVATELHRKNMSNNMKSLYNSYMYMYRELSKEPSVTINSDPDHTAHTCLNISIDGVNGEELLTLLNEVDICVSTGSACSSKSNKPSYVLTSLGLTEEQANSSIRISLNEQIPFEDIKIATSHILNSANILRNRK